MERDLVRKARELDSDLRDIESFLANKPYQLVLWRSELHLGGYRTAELCIPARYSGRVLGLLHEIQKEIEQELKSL